MVHRVVDLTDDVQIVLAQEIVVVVDGARLRVLHRHHGTIELGAGDLLKDLGKGLAGHNVDGLAKVAYRRFLTVSPALALKRYPGQAWTPLGGNCSRFYHSMHGCEQSCPFWHRLANKPRPFGAKLSRRTGAASSAANIA